MNSSTLAAETTRAINEARALHARLTASASAEGRALGPGEMAAISEATAHATQLKTRLERSQGDDAMTAEINRLTGGGADAPRFSGASPRGGSLGAQFLNSETYRWLRQHRGSLPTGAWTSASSELEMYATTLTEDGASGGALVNPDYRPGIVSLPTRPLVVADLIAPGVTDSNMISYMKETTFTNAADTVAEGGTKPESTLVFAAVTDPVRKIAHWLPVSEELLEDSAASQSYIDMRLRLGVQLAEDDQLLNGSVVAPDVVGFLARTGLAASIARVAEANADTILSQIMAIWIATGLQPTGVVMNPANWKTILMTKDTTGNYYGGGPFASPHAPSIWGLPVALTSNIVANTALVGCFRTAAQLFRKGGLRVEASNSHASFFVSNLIAIRAEERIALAVYRPACFGTVTNLT